MKSTIYSNNLNIGIADLIVTDSSMGVLGGRFSPNENYNQIRPVIWKFMDAPNGQKDFNSLKKLRINVQLENEYFVFALGAVTIWDHPECKDDPIEIDVAGVYRHVIDDFFLNQSPDSVLQEPWEFISIDQKLAFEDELSKEIGEKAVEKKRFWSFHRKKSSNNHPLVDYNFSAVAKSGRSDDVLFAIDVPLKDNQSTFAVVHLTWKGSQEHSPQWPRTEYFGDFAEFKEKRMGPENADWDDS